MTIGQKIRLYRESIGMSQDELAKLCGYRGRSSISRIEKDEADVPQKKIKLLANALLVTPGQLLDPEQDPDNHLRDTVAIMISGLDGEDLARVLQFVEFVKSQHK